MLWCLEWKWPGGSPPADIDISGGPDMLPTAISVTTVVSEKWMEIDTPDAVVSGMEVAGGSPPADIDISRGRMCYRQRYL